MSELTREERALLEGRAEAIVAELLVERRRQVDEEGYNPKHDEAHGFSDLALGGAAYAFSATRYGAIGAYRSWILLHLWPWWAEQFKPKDPRRDLVRAGALIVAALERLDRETIQRAEDAA